MSSQRQKPVEPPSLALRHVSSSKLESTDIPPSALDFNLEVMEMLLTDGIAGFAYVDLDFKFVRLNQVLASIYDRQAVDLIGRSVAEMVGEANWDKVRPCLVAAGTGTTVLGVHACEDRPDSTGVIRQRVSSFYPVRSAGAVVGVAAVINDVTDRVIAEQTMRESEAKYRLLAESIPHLVWMIDVDGNFTYTNHRFTEYVGATFAAIDSHTWLHYIDPIDRPSAEALWRDVREAGVSFELECRLPSRYGVPRWFLVRALPMSDEKGSSIRWLGTCTDIHDQKSAEESRRFLDTLSERMRAKESPDEILTEVVTGLGRHLRVSRCRFGENDWQNDRLIVRHEYCAPGYSPTTPSVPRGSLSRAITDPLLAGNTVSVYDSHTDPRTAEYTDIYQVIEFRSGIVAPIIRNGIYVANLSVTMTHEPREWRDDEVELVTTVAARTWLALENARLYREKLQADVNQRTFVREVLAIVTDGRLNICEIPSELPTQLPRVTESFDLMEDVGVRNLRHAARDVAEEHGYERARCQDLMTAVSEAAMNALVHAKGGEGWVCAANDAIQVWIVDRGLGISVENLPHATLVRGYSTAATLGHGFKMIISCTDRVNLLTNASGTTVVVEQFKQAPGPNW